MRKSKIKRFLFRLGSFFGIIALPIFTFVFSIVVTLLWQEFVSPPTVSLCQLARTPYFYAWRTVRVEADAYGGFGAVFIVDKTCNLTDTAASGVWRADGYEPSAEVQKLYAESDSETYKARILVTGHFDPDATMGCFAPKAAIRATSIELKSEIETELMEKRKK